MTTATVQQQAARILEVCIQQTAVALALRANRDGIACNERDVIAAVEADPEGPAARAFQTMFLAALKGAREAVAA